MTDTITALLHGPDQPGIVARVAGWILENGGNIVHADQHHDPEQGVFFQRVEWVHRDGGDAGERAREFASLAAEMGMEVRTALSSGRPRVAVMVSKAPHALHELAQNWQTGDLPCEMALVVGNHTTLAPIAANYASSSTETKQWCSTDFKEAFATFAT